VSAPRDDRPENQVEAVLRAHANLRAVGLRFFPLGTRSKTPRDPGWQLNDYRHFNWRHHTQHWGNAGVLLARNQLVIDIDPRNNGDVSFERLRDVHGVNVAHCPTVKTGGGGLHIYAELGGEMHVRKAVQDLPGIDFQSFGRYVVAPGSIHPVTGLAYRRTAPFPAALPKAPSRLIDLIAKAPSMPRKVHGDGQVSPEQLAVLLAALNPSDYGQGGMHHHQWLDLAMAAHAATNGDGLEEWLAWCARDEQYGSDAGPANTTRWESFNVDRGDGISVRTLLKAVSEAGRRDLVAQIGPSAADDFADEDKDLLVYDAPEEGEI
jgi:hypothetical protein